MTRLAHGFPAELKLVAGKKCKTRETFVHRLRHSVRTIPTTTHKLCKRTKIHDNITTLHHWRGYQKINDRPPRRRAAAAGYGTRRYVRAERSTRIEVNDRSHDRRKKMMIRRSKSFTTTSSGDLCIKHHRRTFVHSAACGYTVQMHESTELLSRQHIIWRHDQPGLHVRASYLQCGAAGPPEQW